MQHEILSYQEFADAPEWKHDEKPNEKCKHDKNVISKARSSIYSLETFFERSI